MKIDIPEDQDFCQKCGYYLEESECKKCEELINFLKGNI